MPRQFTSRFFRSVQRKIRPWCCGSPKFPYRKEENARLGSLEPADYGKLHDALIPHAWLVLVIGYHTGCTAKKSPSFAAIRWILRPVSAASRRSKPRGSASGLLLFTETCAGCLKMAKADRDINHPRCPHVIAETECVLPTLRGLESGRPPVRHSESSCS
jgi:hypothetical protein